MADGPLTQETPNNPTDPTILTLSNADNGFLAATPSSGKCNTGGLEGSGFHTTCTSMNAV